MDIFAKQQWHCPPGFEFISQLSRGGGEVRNGTASGDVAAKRACVPDLTTCRQHD